MRAASAQFSSTPFALTRNLETAERLIREAAAQGAQIVVLPELFNTGYVYTPRLFSAAETSDSTTLRWLTNLSAELNVHLAGSLLLREGAHIFNTFVLVTPAGKIHKYRKQYPFLWEYCYFESGREPLIVETDLGRFGLLVCWDIAYPLAWEAYRGNVDAVLVASAAPRLHRAVLNFPLGKKIYLAQVMPIMLRQREAMDRWFAEDLGMRAAQMGAPVIHAAMAGRFVTEVPFPRLSFFAAALTKPTLWPLAAQAHLTSLRATFYGTSAIYSAQGESLAQVAGEEGYAIADVALGVGSPPPVPPNLYIPPAFRFVEFMLKLLSSAYYRRHLSSVIR
jgi:predicted amidohydrolase